MLSSRGIAASPVRKDSAHGLLSRDTWVRYIANKRHVSALTAAIRPVGKLISPDT